MEQTRIKKSDLVVSRLCMGGCPMGQHGWGQVDKSDLILTVNAALDAGINFFDTADVYGLGESERTLGEALGCRRKDAVIASKFGVRVQPGKGTFYDNSPEWMEEALTASLKRLNTDYIDLYQVHYRDGVTPIEEVAQSLEKMRQKGYIRYYGFSNVFHQDAVEIKPFAAQFVSVQDECSLARRDNEADLMYLSDLLELTPMTWGSLGQGILTGKYDEHSTFGPDDRRSREIYINFHGEKLRQNLRIVDVMRGISARIGKPLPAIAMRFILDSIPGSITLVGMKNSKQLSDDLCALDWHLDPKDFRALDEISDAGKVYERQRANG